MQILNPEIDKLDFQNDVDESIEKSKEFFTSALTLAGFEILHTFQLSNQYWPTSYVDLVLKNPWWLFKTDVGDIVIGPRKRVIELDWQHTGLKAADLTEDDVTKSDTFIHAWTKEKLIHYLITLRSKFCVKQGETNAN